MMGDDRLLDHPQSVELLSICLGDNLQSCPETCLRETGHHPDPLEPLGEHTWTFNPPEPTKQDTPPRSSGIEPDHVGNCSSQRELRPTAASSDAQGYDCTPGTPPQSQSSSTQVVFWAGILQAQMCVLDLEEELEKTEGLKTRLRCCLPTSTPDLSGDTGLHRSPPTEGDSGEDSSGPEGENQAWPREGSSPEWGPEEESVFFDNPLFLESPASDISVSRECFSWGFPDSQADVRPGSDWPFPCNSRPLELGNELDLGGSTAGSSGCTTPPFPVPPYKSHPFCWTSVATAEGTPTAPPAQEEGEDFLEDDRVPASPAEPFLDKTSTWETAYLGLDLSPATHPTQPWAPPRPEGWQTEEGPSWPQDRGEPDARCPQEPTASTFIPNPCGSPASSPKPDSPVSKGSGLGPMPTPVSSHKGSPQLQHHSPGIFPKWPLNASHPLLLEIDGIEPSSLKKEEAGKTPDPEQEVESEGTARIALAAGVQPNIHWTSAERSPESPTPQAQFPKEDQRSPGGDKLANGIRNDKVAWNLASRLYHLDGFRKSEVAAYLQKNNDFSRAVAEEYLSFFQFGGQSLDCALRAFLQALVLSGETQERERILYQFSRRFHHCNPEAFPSVDSIHTLTCAIMLLNTDLHGQNIGKSMSCQEFIANLNGLQDGGNFPKELLKALYWSIRNKKLEWVMDEEESATAEKARPSPPAGKMSKPFLQLAQDPTVPTYKQGILARKMHHDADGKKTPWGKRGWKMFHTLLRGMVLYFLKGEDQSLDGESLVGQMVDEPVGVHHALATPATHYTKKPHVFQLRTADWRLYLFQAPTAKEMTSWIARINLAAATHSAPPFPAAVGSQRRFVRPILPVGPAQSSLEEQHRSHETCLDAASDDLLDLQKNLPEQRGRSRVLEEHRLRKEYLEYEKTRYETYVQLLVARLHCSSRDLDLWEEQLGREAEDTREPKPSLKKSHSSPSLHQDEAPTTAKVKRNISERRTYRKIIPKRNRNQL